MKQYAIIKAFSSGLPTQAEPPENIQWAPPGKHAISATRGDKPVKMTVDVTSDAVAALNESLEEIRGSGHNPYIDFNHDDKEASGWIDSFYWGGDDPVTGGIRAKVRWSEEGAAKLKGKSYDRFSPTFLTNTKGKIIGTTPNTGGLVNRPAFHQIASIMQASEADTHLQFVSASYQPEDETKNQEPKKGTTMSPEEKKKMDDLEAENTELKKKVKALEDDKEKTEAKAKEAAVKALVEGAIKDGKIMAKDQTQIDAITAMATADLKNTQTLLETMPTAIKAKEGLFQRITPDQGASGAVSAQDKQTQMTNAVESIKAKHPNLTGEAAFDLACKENPELFAVTP